MRLRRMVVGMSQEKLGEHLNLTFQQIQKYEKGVNRIGAGRLYRMATVLGVDVSFFFEGLSQELMETVPSGLSEPDGTPYLMGFLATPEGLQLNSA
ncbi:MAG: helix-turn-helix transcriptional regulator, partial [Pseudomonadota bacterium]